MMTVAALTSRLRAEAFNPDVYTVPGEELKENTLCLQLTADGWAVFFYEKGQRWAPNEFPSENDACGHFYQQLVEDPSTRLAWLERPVPDVSVDSLPPDDPRRLRPQKGTEPLT